MHPVKSFDQLTLRAIAIQHDNGHTEDSKSSSCVRILLLTSAIGGVALGDGDGDETGDATAGRFNPSPFAFFPLLTLSPLPCLALFGRSVLLRSKMPGA